MNDTRTENPKHEPESGTPGTYPFCPHGARLGGSNLPNGIPWNGPVGRCSCCFSVFGYIESGSFSADRGSHGRYWYPKDKCGSCGGSYHEH